MVVKGRTGIFPMPCRVLIQLHVIMMKSPGGATSTSPLHMCLDGSKESTVLGARLLWQSMPKNPNVKHTSIASANALRLLASTVRWGGT